MLSILCRSRRGLVSRPLIAMCQSNVVTTRSSSSDGVVKTSLADTTIPPSSAPSSPQPLMDRSEKGIFQRFFDKHNIKKQTDRILVAESFLQAATRQASDPRWFGPGRISTDFRSYQALLTMHVWFLHKRLISDNQDPHAAALVQEELFDILWTDSTNRMRAHGVNEWLLNKNLKSVQQYTFMHCFHYDHCYTELLDKPKERLEELKNLVQTHILLLNPDDFQAQENSIDQAERIAWYIETQYINIMHDLPEDFYRKARIAWVDLPDFSDLQDGKGNILEPIVEDSSSPSSNNNNGDDDELPKSWVKNIANDGSYYYWNTETREAQWEKPTS